MNWMKIFILWNISGKERCKHWWPIMEKNMFSTCYKSVLDNSLIWFRLDGFHKRSQSQMRLAEIKLKFCTNNGSNMAAIILSPLQNLKWLIIRHKYIKQSPEVVFGCVFMVTRFPKAWSQLTPLPLKPYTNLPEPEGSHLSQWFSLGLGKVWDLSWNSPQVCMETQNVNVYILKC